ncbi:hypothetical protein AB4Z50_34385 [Paenibacillus sp. 2TAB26]|uniref:hypothetical protein n=1 Tax=Paenibacillus sp. 2TAB26 TaxID=3233005 RepID=UPI003F9959A4
MTFRKRMLVLSIIDSLLLLGSWMFAFYLIYGELLPQSLSVTDVAVAGLFIITSYFFLVISKSYKTLWKYAGVHELIRVFKSVAAAVILYAAELLLFTDEQFPFLMLVVLGLTSAALPSGITYLAR